MSISTIDWAVIIIYLLGVVGLGCWAGWNARRQGGESVAGDYFMAAHTLKWPVIGLAIVSVLAAIIFHINFADGKSTLALEQDVSLAAGQSMKLSLNL